MTFDDLPQIDQYAMNEEDSRQKFREFFNEGRGFRARPQTPDNGTDYMVELLSNGRATNNHFGVQLKSEVTLSKIEKGSIISYTFKTSRLRYLLQHKPKVGLIAVYHVNDKVIYFDYVINIYRRLSAQKSEKNWTEQENVNIHIPVENVLTHERAAKVHEDFTLEFKLLEDLIGAFSPRYGMTVVPELKRSEVDFNNPEDIRKLLKQHGMAYLSQNSTDMVHNLISKLTEQEINADKELMIVHAVVKGMMGLNIDSNFIIAKIRRNYKLTDSEAFALNSAESNNKLTLKEITVAEFISVTKELASSVEGDENRLGLRLNTMFFELLLIRNMEKVPTELLTELGEIEKQIDQFANERIRFELKLRAIENRGLLFSHDLNDGINKLVLRRSLEKPMGLNERLIEARKAVSKHGYFHESIRDIMSYAKKTDNKVLLAETQCVNLRYQLEFHKSLLLAESPHEAEGLESVEDIIQNACTAIDIFSEYHLYRRAYNTVNDVLEFGYLIEHHYKFTLSRIPFDLLRNNQRALEILLELPENSYQLFMPVLLEHLFGEVTINTDNSLSAEQLQNLAKEIMASGKYPNAKLEYIVGELKGYQIFAQRNTDDSLDIIVALYANPRDAYTRPTRYRIIRKVSGLMSDFDTDIDRLLKNWGY